MSTSIKHHEDGNYGWNIDGTNFDPDDLDYSAGEIKLEQVAWVDSNSDGTSDDGVDRTRLGPV